MSGELRIFADEKELFAGAAATFVDAACAVLAVRPQFSVALAGGSTPRGLFELLASPAYRDSVDWKKVVWFWGDERSVGAEHPDSNYRMATEALLSHVAVDPGLVHRLCGETEPLSKGAEDYQQTLAKAFGIPADGPPPSLDLVLLGMGSDGHTASLFPFTAALDEKTRWVVANDVPQLTTRRLTLTYPVLNAAGCVLFLVTGAGKAKVLREVRQGPHDPRRLPSQTVDPQGGRLLWFVDRAAASQLE